MQDGQRGQLEQTCHDVVHVKRFRRCRLKVLWLARVQQLGFWLRQVLPDITSYREVVLAAETQYGKALLHVPEEEFVDPEVVVTTTSEIGNALRYVASALKRRKSL